MFGFTKAAGTLLGAAAIAAATSGAAVAQDEAALADLKAKVNGQSVVLAFGAPPNLLEVQSVMVANILKNEFGVDATYQAVPADVSAAAVVSGSADVGEVSLGRIAGLREGGADVQIFASNDYINDFVIVGKTPIASMADLKGHIYGDSGSAGIGKVLRDACFRDSGITVDDVQLVELGSSGATAQALATPQLEAGLIHADSLASLQAKFPDQYNVLCYVYEKTSVANDVWYSTKSWLDANPDMALAVTVAAMMAGREVYADKDAWMEVATSFVPDLLPGVADATYDLFAEIGLWDVNGALSAEDCEANMEVLVGVGALQSAVPCDELVTESLQTRAREILGTVER